MTSSCYYDGLYGGNEIPIKRPHIDAFIPWNINSIKFDISRWLPRSALDGAIFDSVQILAYMYVIRILRISQFYFSWLFWSRSVAFGRLMVKLILRSFVSWLIYYSHVKDKTVARPPYLYHGDSYTVKTKSMYTTLVPKLEKYPLSRILGVGEKNTPFSTEFADFEVQ